MQQKKNQKIEAQNELFGDRESVSVGTGNTENFRTIISCITQFAIKLSKYYSHTSISLSLSHMGIDLYKGLETNSHISTTANTKEQTGIKIISYNNTRWTPHEVHFCGLPLEIHPLIHRTFHIAHAQSLVTHDMRPYGTEKQHYLEEEAWNLVSHSVVLVVPLNLDFSAM